MHAPCLNFVSIGDMRRVVPCVGAQLLMQTPSEGEVRPTVLIRGKGYLAAGHYLKNWHGRFYNDKQAIELIASCHVFFGTYVSQSKQCTTHPQRRKRASS